MRQLSEQKTVISKIAYFAIFASLIGANVLAIDLVFFQLSLFRMTILFVVFLFFLSLRMKTQSLAIIGDIGNRFSIAFMLLWACYAVLSFFWVQDYIAWMKAVYFLSLNVICVVLFTNAFKQSTQILTCLRVFAVMIVLHNLMGWYELIAKNYFFLEESLVIYYRHFRYPVSIFGNTNDFATFLLISIFILYTCMQNAKSRLMKYFYIVMIISSVVLLYMTSSRANMLGLIIAFAVLVWMNLYNKKTQMLVFIVFLLLCILIAMKPELLEKAFSMIGKTFYFNKEKVTDSVNIRMNLLKNGGIFLIDTFGMGTGAGNVGYWMANASIYDTNGITDIHNWWMEILTGYGITIFVLYIMFYVLLFRSCYIKYKMAITRIDKTVSLCFLCCLAGYVIGGISSSSNISSEWLWVFWSIVIAYQGLKMDELQNGVAYIGRLRTKEQSKILEEVGNKRCRGQQAKTDETLFIRKCGALEK